MPDSTDISFKPLREEDIPMLHRWLNEPHVHEWYGKRDSNSLEEVKKRYMPKINGEKPVRAFIMYYHEQPVGYIQVYRVHDYPDYAKYILCDDSTASVDLFIGASEMMGKGFGSEMLKKFLEKEVFAKGFTRCIIGPEPANKRAIRAYEKVGFRYVKTVYSVEEDEEMYVMENYGLMPECSPLRHHHRDP